MTLVYYIVAMNEINWKDFINLIFSVSATVLVGALFILVLGVGVQTIVNAFLKRDQNENTIWFKKDKE